MSFSLQMESRRAQSLSSPLIRACVSEAPLSFYCFFLVYFKDYSIFLCQFILPHVSITVLDVHFIQAKVNTIGLHGPEHVQKGSSVPNQNLLGPA